MTTLIGIGVIVLAFGAILWGARKAGTDAVKAQANEQAVKDILETVRPATDTERQRVRSLFRRD